MEKNNCEIFTLYESEHLNQTNSYVKNDFPTEFQILV